MPNNAQTDPKQAAQKSDNGIIFILAYLFTWLTGIIVYFVYGEKDKRLKFHAVQAILFGIALIIVVIIIGIIPFVGVIAGLVGFLGWIYGLYVGWQGMQGKDIEMPVIGQYARQHSK